jgi:hypothetical protein
MFVTRQTLSRSCLLVHHMPCAIPRICGYAASLLATLVSGRDEV